jgi:predicted acyltransferase
MEKQDTQKTGRLHSLDALRGFDMFWIMGGGEIFVVLAALTGWPILKWWSGQLEHVAWNGFHFEDMIFPLFLFIAGISFPFSMAKRFHGPENRKALYAHIIKRGLILVLLGIIYNNAIRFDFANMRYASVLGRIGLAWMFAALIFMNTNLKFRMIWFWGILIGYWLLLLLFPAHDLGNFDRFSPQGCLVGHLDRLFLPGKFCCYSYGDNEGLLSLLPAICTAMLGMLTGQFIMSEYLSDKPLRKVLYMALAAVVLIILGRIWNIVFPINKNLWSSSFVLFVGGLSLLLFTLFYLVIDIWKFKGWTGFFTVIGMNSITIYLAHRVIDFQYAAKFLFGGLIELFPANYAALLGTIAYVAIAWIFLYFLYKKKIFLKV